MKQKFSELDRNRVVAFLQEERGVRLRRRGRSRKAMEDEAGRPYFVFGAHGDWHGVRTEDLDAAVGGEGVLVIAFPRSEGIDVYEGPLRQLVEGRHALSTTESGCYQFHTERGAGRVRVKEVPGLTLTFVGRLGPHDYPRADRPPKRPPTPEEWIEAGFKTLSQEEQERVIAMLQQRLT